MFALEKTKKKKGWCGQKKKRENLWSLVCAKEKRTEQKVFFSRSCTCVSPFHHNMRVDLKCHSNLILFIFVEITNIDDGWRASIRYFVKRSADRPLFSCNLPSILTKVQELYIPAVIGEEIYIDSNLVINQCIKSIGEEPFDSHGEATKVNKKKTHQIRKRNKKQRRKNQKKLWYNPDRTDRSIQ